MYRYSYIKMILLTMINYFPIIFLYNPMIIFIELCLILSVKTIIPAILKCLIILPSVDILAAKTSKLIGGEPFDKNFKESLRSLAASVLLALSFFDSVTFTALLMVSIVGIAIVPLHKIFIRPLISRLILISRKISVYTLLAY